MGGVEETKGAQKKQQKTIINTSQYKQLFDSPVLYPT
jgi:hypothetical protein